MEIGKQKLKQILAIGYYHHGVMIIIGGIMQTATNLTKARCERILGEKPKEVYKTYKDGIYRCKMQDNKIIFVDVINNEVNEVVEEIHRETEI